MELPIRPGTVYTFQIAEDGPHAGMVTVEATRGQYRVSLHFDPELVTPPTFARRFEQLNSEISIGIAALGLPI